MDYKQLYYENSKFKEYVDRLMNPKKRFAGRSMEEVLAMKIVQEVWDYYAKNSDTPYSPISPSDICECDDKSC